jgi:hypothetical protein
MCASRPLTRWQCAWRRLGPAQPHAHHAPKEKGAGHREETARDVTEQDERDAARDHGDTDEGALRRGGSYEGLSDDWTAAVGHEGCSFQVVVTIISSTY